jgi:hypothetical protein|tara:strand:+ start:166 stop:387 length:222 start_codon:yes stop_codon:yes gene_type:complete
MAIFSNKKHTSKLYKVVANSIKKDQTISKGLGKKQSKQTSPGDRKYDPMLSMRSNQGLEVNDTIDMMISKAIK